PEAWPCPARGMAGFQPLVNMTKGTFPMNTISNSRRLRQEIERVLPILTNETSAVVLHPQFRELYPEFLITVHQMVRATVPLMRAALRRCLELKETDPVAAAMAPDFEQHIKEEMHHD